MLRSLVRRLIVTQLVVLVVLGVAGGLLFSWATGLAASVGLLSFSIPLILFSLMISQPQETSPSSFWGRFMAAEFLKWLAAGVLLALAFASHLFMPLALLAGFLASVVVQMFFPILVKRGSQS